MSILQVITCYDVKVLLEVAIIGMVACVISGVILITLSKDYSAPAVVIKIIFLIVLVIGFILIAIGGSTRISNPSETKRTYVVTITDNNIFPKLYEQGYTLERQYDMGNVYKITGPIIENESDYMENGT